MWRPLRKVLPLEKDIHGNVKEGWSEMRKAVLESAQKHLQGRHKKHSRWSILKECGTNVSEDVMEKAHEYCRPCTCVS